LPPEEVAQRAAAWGVQLFCLTDHDTCQGYAATADVLVGSDVNVLRGLELSCREIGRTIHMLVYGLREGPGLETLRERLDVQHTARVARLRAICERLAKLGIALDPDAVLQRSHGVPGRPDVARALVAAGVCSSPREAFTRFLRDGGPADVEIDRVSLEEGLALARAAGGRMSLAHPHSIGEPALVRELYRRFRDAGLEGLEAFYGKYARAESNAWLRMCDELDLVATGGSDFHGDMAPEVARPGIEIPDARANVLAQWLAT
jgi:predicted metal-dependent phosphoesterase TrpH